MRTKPGKLIALLTICLAVFIGCQKEIKPDFDAEIPASPEAPIWKTAGVTGQVIDINEMPVEGAEVKFGTSTRHTDKNGYFSFADASFSTGEAFVTVKKAGYFGGSRTFFPRQGSNNYIRVKLINYTLSGLLDANSGGETELRNGMRIELPSGGIATANGTSYSGEVNLFATYLDPTASDLNERMPGDLRGVNVGGQQRILKSLGMVAVELNSPSGQPLNLKTGSKAKLTFPIPAALVASAPATVPLWYFNETTGLWVEEGVATKQGGEYIGEVSHFSFWNVDVPYEFIKLSIKITGPDNNPIAGAKVKLTSLQDKSATYDFTDNTGYVVGGVPKGQQLTMEVFDNCEKVVFTSTIGPFNSDTDLGSKQVGSKVLLQTIFGTVTACNGNPLASGVLQVLLNNNQSEFSIIENGKFSITFLTCSGATNAKLIAIDNDHQQQGNPVTVQFDSTAVNAGTIAACGVAINAFLNISVNGIPRTWNNTNSEVLLGFEDTSYTYPNGDHDLVILAGDTSNNQEPSGIYLQHPPGNLTAPASLLMSDGFWTIDPTTFKEYGPVDTSLMKTTLTSYGPVGQFIEGNFNGRFFEYDGVGTTDTVTVSGSFRVRRVNPW